MSRKESKVSKDIKASQKSRVGLLSECERDIFSVIKSHKIRSGRLPNVAEDKILEIIKKYSENWDE